LWPDLRISVLYTSEPVSRSYRQGRLWGNSCRSSVAPGKNCRALDLSALGRPFLQLRPLPDGLGTHRALARRLRLAGGSEVASRLALGHAVCASLIILSIGLHHEGSPPARHGRDDAVCGNPGAPRSRFHCGLDSLPDLSKGQQALDLSDGNRVHLDKLDCLLRFGERWRSEAAAGLRELGLDPPAASNRYDRYQKRRRESGTPKLRSDGLAFRRGRPVEPLTTKS